MDLLNCDVNTNAPAIISLPRDAATVWVIELFWRNIVIACAAIGRGSHLYLGIKHKEEVCNVRV